MTAETSTSTLDPLGIRLRLGRHQWSPPREFGPDGWMYDGLDGLSRVIVTAGEHEGGDWWHASISRHVMPTYDDLCTLHAAVWLDGWAYQVFAPPADHVNIHARALHLWGRPDGRAVLPNFGALGTI